MWGVVKGERKCHISIQYHTVDGMTVCTCADPPGNILTTYRHVHSTGQYGRVYIRVHCICVCIIQYNIATGD